MASSTYHTITIQNFHHAQMEEAVAATSAAIKPGHLLAYNTTGQYKKHAVAAGLCAPILVALEDLTVEPSATAAIDTAYSDGATVYAARAKSGDVYYMFAAHSTGNNYQKGITKLVSNGAGLVKAYALSTGLVDGAFIGVPDENLDNSATGGATARLRVRIA